MSESVLVAFPTPLRTVTQVRSTLVQSSVEALREAGHFERYVKLLDPVHRQAVLETFAATWVPLDAALAHYRAADKLGLSEAEMVQLGRGVGQRIQRSSLSSIVRAGRSVGITPWTVLGQVDRLWTRVMEGGGVRVVQTGPKDAVVEIGGLPLAECVYFRVAFRGLFHTMGDLLTSKNYVRMVEGDFREQRLKYRLSWV